MYRGYNEKTKRDKMSNIKLQVGKTYRSREGEEVKIVRNGGGEYPCQGDNGYWYTESGRWEGNGVESPDDLIEEVMISDVNQKHNEMKTLKLQVGKTYRNRKGEEVKIIGKNNKCWYPYQGDNGYWYMENGKWDNYCTRHPENLVAEVTISNAKVETTHRTFEIPDGMKIVTVEQIGDRIIIEMRPKKEPKPGDVMINIHGNVYIFKEVVGMDVHKCYAWAGEGGRLTVESLCFCGRPATPEEAQPLWDALKKAGKRWNPETMQVEDVPEKEQIDKFLKAYADGVMWSREQLRWLIEYYLKHRESEK